MQTGFQKRFKIEACSDTFYWIEGIGSTRDLFHGSICGADGYEFLYKATSGGDILYIDTLHSIEPKANFIIDSIVVNKVYFHSISYDGCYHKWFFGDGDSISIINPVHIYKDTGSYNVMLIYSLVGKSDTIVKLVQITQIDCSSLTSAFSFSDSLLTVNFTDLSTNATGWLWDFGDGVTDTIQHPVHIYDSAGTYIVMLAASYGNCSDTAYGNVVVSDLTGISDKIFKNNFQIYPNPGKNILTIKIKSINIKEIIIKVYNIKGKEIFTDIVNKYRRDYIKELDISKFSKGIYTVLAIIGDERIVKKIIID